MTEQARKTPWTLTLTKLMEFGHHDFIDDAFASNCDSNNAFCENSLLFQYTWIDNENTFNGCSWNNCVLFNFTSS